MRNKVFVSYSHKDNKYLEELKTHLKPFLRNGDLDCWDDTRIRAGQNWHKEIKLALSESCAAILLISPHFLASDYIDQHELPSILKRAEDDGVTILPVILAQSRFTLTKLSKFKTVNNPNRPLKKLRPVDRDSVWTKLTIDLEHVINGLRQNSITSGFGQNGRPEQFNKGSFKISEFDNNDAIVKTESDTIELEFDLDRDFDDYSEEELIGFIRAIQGFLPYGDVKIKRIKRGSVRVILEVPTDLAGEIIRAAEEDKFRDFGVLDVHQKPLIDENMSIQRILPPIDVLERLDRELLENNLKNKVIGQDEAIREVTEFIATRPRAWLINSKKPLGVFLFIGPTGVGKTELALQLTAEIMQDERSMVVKNMAEYQGQGASSRFMGADPGYIGWGKGSTVYHQVLLRPYSVVVLDEIEKASAELSNALMSLLDGEAEDAAGNWVDFSQCIFILTSEELFGLIQEHKSISEKHIRQLLISQGGIWQRTFVDRIDRIIIFNPLTEQVLAKLLELWIDKLNETSTRPLPSSIFEPEVQQNIILQAVEHGGGATSARDLQRALQRWLRQQ